jgi:hypothetical protein
VLINIPQKISGQENLGNWNFSKITYRKHLG